MSRRSWNSLDQLTVWVSFQSLNSPNQRSGGTPFSTSLPAFFRKFLLLYTLLDTGNQACVMSERAPTTWLEFEVHNKTYTCADCNNNRRAVPARCKNRAKNTFSSSQAASLDSGMNKYFKSSCKTCDRALVLPTHLFENHVFQSKCGFTSFTLWITAGFQIWCCFQ